MIPTIISEGSEEIVLTESIRNTIQGLDYFLVENIRTARRYISRLKLGINIEELRFEKLDKNSNHAEVSEYLLEVEKGRSVGIISESGCPGVADPEKNGGIL